MRWSAASSRMWHGSQCERHCARFREEAVRIDANGASQSQRAVGRSTLCFPDLEPCFPGSIPGARFWSGHPTHQDTAALKDEQQAYSDFTGHVSLKLVAWRRVPVVRVARFVGAAGCIRDTYMERASNGHRRISSPSLDGLSAEAAYYHGSYVFYRNWHGKTLHFNTVCSMRYPRTASSIPAENVR